MELYAHTSGSVLRGSSDGDIDFLSSGMVAMLRMLASSVGRELSSLMSLWRPSDEMALTAAYRHKQK